MQSADDVKFGDRLCVAGGGGLESFLERHGISAGRVFLSAKRAQPASRDADVRGIDMTIDVEIGAIPMHPLAD